MVSGVINKFILCVTLSFKSLNILILKSVKRCPFIWTGRYIAADVAPCPRFSALFSQLSRRKRATSISVKHFVLLKASITKTDKKTTKLKQTKKKKEHQLDFCSPVTGGTNQSGVKMCNSLFIVNCHLQVRQALPPEALMLLQEDRASHRFPVKEKSKTTHVSPGKDTGS